MSTKSKKPKLNPNARKWVRALRSGKYKQAKGVLEKVSKNGETRNCCLGVACRVFIQNGGTLHIETVDGKTNFDGDTEVLPIKVMDWLGLRTTSGDCCLQKGVQLVEINDNGTRFTTIANIIESQPEGLFA